MSLGGEAPEGGDPPKDGEDWDAWPPDYHDLPGFEEFGRVEPDEDARKEGRAYAKGDELREEENKQTTHNIRIWVLRGFAISFSVVFVIRVYHLITPHSWDWLDAQQLQAIDYIVFSGLLGSIIGSRLKQIFGHDE